MRIELSPEDLQPIIDQCLQNILAELVPRLSRLNDRLAYTQPEAAALLGVTPATLRDCRLRGEIIGSRVGKKTLYTREELAAFLARQRIR